MCTEQNVTVGVPERDGRRSRARTMSSTMPHVFLLVESALNVKGVLVEQDSEVHVVGVNSEVIRDVRDMVAGFLKDDCMEPTTGGRDDVGRISAGLAWIPLKKGKTELMVHEIAVRLCQCPMGPSPLDLGCPKLTIGRITAFGLGKRPASAQRLEPIELWVPSWAVLALLLALEAVRTGCVPTWVVQTDRLWDMTGTAGKKMRMLTLVSKCE